MIEVNNGGPAFPAPELGFEEFGQHGAYPGMSLRDYFAAKAMQSFAHGAQNMGALERTEITRQFDMVAEFAYLMADSMIKAGEHS